MRYVLTALFLAVLCTQGAQAQCPIGSYDRSTGPLPSCGAACPTERFDATDYIGTRLLESCPSDCPFFRADPDGSGFLCICQLQVYRDAELAALEEGPTCQPCLAGQQDHDGDGATVCVDCASGFYTNSPSSSSCTACGTGVYSAPGAADARACGTADQGLGVAPCGPGRRTAGVVCIDGAVTVETFLVKFGEENTWWFDSGESFGRWSLDSARSFVSNGIDTQREPVSLPSSAKHTFRYADTWSDGKLLGPHSRCRSV